MNVLYEILEALKCNDLNELDVKWVGSEDGEFAISFEQFKEISNCCDYGEYPSPPEIACDLIVVGIGWFFRRVSADDNYNSTWEFIKVPMLKPNSKKFSRIIGEYWESTSYLNKD